MNVRTHLVGRIVIVLGLLFFFNTAYWGLRVWGHGLYVVYGTLAALVCWRYPTPAVRARIAALLALQYLFDRLPDWLPAAHGGGQGGYTAFLFLYWPLSPRALFVGADHGWEPTATMYMAWGLLGTLVLLPLITYFRGRRFYCTMVCRWSLVAETLGEPFRSKAPKGRWAERLGWINVGLLGIVALLTVCAAAGLQPEFGARNMRQWYQLIFINYLTYQAGVGVIPLWGGRAKCRYNCPMGAYLGFFQVRGRFRLAADRSACTHCAKCDAVCDMGIAVMRFAGRGGLLNSSRCTGCGLCLAVCPTSALRFAYTGDRLLAS